MKLKSEESVTQQVSGESEGGISPPPVVGVTPPPLPLFRSDSISALRCVALRFFICARRLALKLDRGEEEKNQVLRNESSSQVYCNQPAQIRTAIEPSGCSFPPETILSSQEHNLAPQGMYDPPSNNPNILSWFNPRGASVCVPLPNFVNWGIPPCAVPPNFSMPRHPFDSPSNSALREQHNSVTRKLSFDINKDYGRLL
ncbi:protein FAR1-RELATED SEQUENCE 5-like isoform X1 [Carex littledalei]|uniref:Protein FAR1-RELATED SEQUENCE 5-like isoform X1 n=1 Tax=Carex littledalei TaxID=544730 RepID=A0A833R069_9POAL|nr:protein FAR1-RELATED SEQUENCE 5-like isoform X1 [Carex littledalei]